MSLAETMPVHKQPAARLSFVIKPALVGALALGADIVLSSGYGVFEIGSVAGLLALSWLGAVLLCDPLARRSRASRLALAGALLAALSLLIEPGFIAACLFPFYLGLAILLPRYGFFDNALSWFSRLVIHMIISPLGIAFDLLRLGRAGRRRKRPGWMPFLAALLLPLAGSAVFILLFSAANPLIAQALDRFSDFLSAANPVIVGGDHLMFILIAAIPLWGSLRPLNMRIRRHVAPAGVGRAAKPPRFGTGSIVLSLVAFNAIFAVQNLSDLVFLWSGAPLPDGVTLAQYAHDGAQPLIATALLAAAFVLVFLRSGSPLSKNAVVRLLVYIWIGQNVLLVGSSMLRTVDYIEAYSLTEMRVAALIWMGVVAIGLVLICWRIAGGRNGAWLINANALCVAIVLGACSFTNFSAIIARWNIAHSLVVYNDAAQLDLYYLDQLGSDALVPLAEAAGRASDPRLKEPLSMARSAVQVRVEHAQAAWRSWTIANALRLRAAGPIPALAPPS